MLTSRVPQQERTEVQPGRGPSIVAWGGALGLIVLLVVMISAEGHADPLRSPHMGVASICSHQCRVCGFNRHDIVVGVNNNATSSHLENCNPESCSSHSCDALEAGLGELLPAVYLAEGNGLKELLQEYPNTLSWNEKRQSVQVTCSEGFTIANIPLTPSQARLLTE